MLGCGSPPTDERIQSQNVRPRHAPSPIRLRARIAAHGSSIEQIGRRMGERVGVVGSQPSLGVIPCLVTGDTRCVVPLVPKGGMGKEGQHACDRPRRAAGRRFALRGPLPQPLPVATGRGAGGVLAQLSLAGRAESRRESSRGRMGAPGARLDRPVHQPLAVQCACPSPPGCCPAVWAPGCCPICPICPMSTGICSTLPCAPAPASRT